MVNEGDSSKKKGSAKLHVSGNYIWTRVWENVLGHSQEMRPSLLTDSLAEADSHRKSVAEVGGEYGTGFTYSLDIIHPGARSMRWVVF